MNIRSKKFGSGMRLGIFGLLLGGAVLVGAAPGNTGVVINEVYGGGGLSGTNGAPNAPYLNDFIELYNNDNMAVDLSNYSLQYASATNSNAFGSISKLTGSIPAHGYYLIQLVSGGTAGAPLPAADATSTTINMSSVSGKIALANNQTAITIGVPNTFSANAVDVVGYGTANAYEGSGAAPILTLSTSISRKSTGTEPDLVVTDSNNNANDFNTAGAPSPRNAASTVTATPTPTSGGSATATPEPTATATPAATATATPAATATATPAPTATATATPEPTATPTTGPTA
ncbi:MAG: lamin tail domain-containing protein, partial [Cytophagaceae bacterium]